jgi:guanylate kinase
VVGSGRLVIVSGPSGAGKSTVVRRLIAECDLPIQPSVSLTTRSPRPGETPGKDYHFVSREEFQELRKKDAFLECKEVFGQGDWYGTLRATVEEGLAVGKWILLEIDVQGAMEVMRQRSDALSFFVHPGSLTELEARLRGRGTESDQAIARRLKVAENELQYIPEYKYEIVNRTVEESAGAICQLLHQEKEEGVNARST